MRADTKFIRQIKAEANNSAFQEKHTENIKTDFKRKRKIGFSDVIMYTIGNTRSPIGLEAERFSKHIAADEISGAAICKARQKIKYTAFKELFELTAQSAPRENCFHGYHVIAVDGMQGDLPKTPDLCEKYCASDKNKTPIFHAVSAFDVLNEIFISSQFHFGLANERKLACKMIDSVMENNVYAQEQQIWVFDRGFLVWICLRSSSSIIKTTLCVCRKNFSKRPMILGKVNMLIGRFMLKPVYIAAQRSSFGGFSA